MTSFDSLKPTRRSGRRDERHSSRSDARNSGVQLKDNRTGLPDHLKAGIENLSGVSLDNVKVHYSSSRPAQLNAHAFAQGTDIHLGPGQEKHLPHEAWHAVQQMQGRVSPTASIDGVAINDDAGLEQEAETMGDKAAAQRVVDSPDLLTESPKSHARAVQRMPKGEIEELDAMCETLLGKFGEDAIFLGMGGSPAPIVAYLRSKKIRSFAIPLSIKDYKGTVSRDQLGQMAQMLEHRTEMSLDDLTAARVVVMDVTAGGGSIAAGVNALRGLGIGAEGFSIRDAAVPKEKTAYHKLLDADAMTEYPPDLETAKENTLVGNLIRGTYKQYRSVGVFKPQEGDIYGAYLEDEEDLPELAHGSRQRAQELDEFFASDPESRDDKGINIKGYGDAPEGFGFGDDPMNEHKLEEDSIARKRLARLAAIRNRERSDSDSGVEQHDDDELKLDSYKMSELGAKPKEDRKCFLTTACIEARGLPDDCQELTILRAYRDEYLQHTTYGNAWIDEYYRIAPSLVEAIASQADAMVIWARIYDRIQDCIAMIRSGRLDDAANSYRIMVRELQAEFGT